MSRSDWTMKSRCHWAPCYLLSVLGSSTRTDPLNTLTASIKWSKEEFPTENQPPSEDKKIHCWTLIGMYGKFIPAEFHSSVTKQFGALQILCWWTPSVRQKEGTFSEGSHFWQMAPVLKQVRSAAMTNLAMSSFRNPNTILFKKCETAFWSFFAKPWRWTIKQYQFNKSDNNVEMLLWYFVFSQGSCPAAGVQDQCNDCFQFVFPVI